MKQTNNQSNSDKAESILLERGFYKLVKLYDDIDSVGSLVMKFVSLLFVIIKLVVSIYYYPRSLQYFFAHPISETHYLLKSLVDVYFYITLWVVFGTAIIALVLRRFIAIKASKIFYQTYYELGAEAPDLEL